MSALALARGDRDSVVFWVARSLAYPWRMAIALALVAAGFALQMAQSSFFPGVLLLAAGNLLLLVRGYDNRVDFGAYDPHAEWQPVALERLTEVKSLERRIRGWDTSALDVSNLNGGCMLVLLIILGAVVVLALPLAGVIPPAFGDDADPYMSAIVGDAALLLIPHWLTGTRRVLLLPALGLKAEVLRELLLRSSQLTAGHQVTLLAEVRRQRDSGAAMPTDFKLRIDPGGHDPDFLGVYVQVVSNEVQGQAYPYVYAVLVARPAFGLAAACAALVRAPGDGGESKAPWLARLLGTVDIGRVIHEQRRQGEVDILVVRQYTTSSSGYHTDEGAQDRVFAEAMRIATAVARGPG